MLMVKNSLHGGRHAIFNVGRPTRRTHDFSAVKRKEISESKFAGIELLYFSAADGHLLREVFDPLIYQTFADLYTKIKTRILGGDVLLLLWEIDKHRFICPGFHFTLQTELVGEGILVIYAVGRSIVGLIQWPDAKMREQSRRFTENSMYRLQTVLRLNEIVAAETINTQNKMRWIEMWPNLFILDSDCAAQVTNKAQIVALRVPASQISPEEKFQADKIIAIGKRLNAPRLFIDKEWLEQQPENDREIMEASMSQKIRDEAHAQISDPIFFMPSVIKLLPTAFRDQVHVNAVIGIYNQTHSRTISMNEETLICTEPGYLAQEGTQIGSLNPNETSLSECFVMMNHVGGHTFYYVRGYRETLQRVGVVDPFTNKAPERRFIRDVENAQRGGKLLPIVSAEGARDLVMYAENMTIKDHWPVFRGNPLTVRKLTFFGMTRLDNSIGMMKNLTDLDCSDNKLISLPPELGNLTALEKFICSENNLTSLPPELGNLTALKWFNCSNNQLTTLPPELGKLTALMEFNCFNNQLTTLPPELGNLTALVGFDCSVNRLISLPPELDNLSALKMFNCSKNELTTLPPELGNLTALEKFYCFNNRLTTLPPELGNLIALEQVDCSNNKLTTLPPELGNLTALVWFNCSYNKLTSLPPELGNLTALEWFFCTDNPLTSLPEEIVNLRNLKRLHISNTNITAVPHGLLLLPGLNVTLSSFLRSRYGTWEAMQYQLGHAQSHLSSTPRGVVII
jgi:Leucine-rich repeat (LRR) protein